jgi:hypothetical protein
LAKNKSSWLVKDIPSNEKIFVKGSGGGAHFFCEFH